MRREQALLRHLHSLESLGEAVNAMKSLSAHHFRETRQAVEPAWIYREGIESVLRRAGASLPAGSGPTGLLVIGGELGLCGNYNAQLVAAAAERRGALGKGPTYCVGRRASSQLARIDVDIDRTYAAPTSIRGIPELLLRLAEDVLGAYATSGLSSFHVVSSRFEGVGAARPVSAQLLPLLAEREPPAHVTRYVSREHLALAAVQEFLYIELYEVLLDALAGEHSARLIATQSAGKWLDEQCATLRRHIASTRREASTQEMIEIVGAARLHAATRRAG